MSNVSYLDQNALLGECYVTRSYKFLHDKILRECDALTYALCKNNEVYGYSITLNQPLTELYQFSCYVVKFVFSGVDTLHSKEQEDIMHELCTSLKSDIEKVKGYYTLRVPTHIVDLLKAINQSFDRPIFCGGTVEEIHVGTLNPPTWSEDIKLFFADQLFIEEHKTRLISMAFDSFKNYQGQYHISPVTSEDAGKVYSQWIENALNNYKENTLLVAQHDQELAGYCTIAEGNVAVEAVLSSVNQEKRKLGTYKAMISTLIRYAKSKEKLFVTSTQFDNYIVQGTWNSLGLRPFYSIYNIHFDCRF